MTTATLPRLDPATARRRVADGSAILVDIREPGEWARARISGARLAPLSALDRADLAGERDKAAIFHCQSGNRTASNAARLAAAGFAESYALDGGLDGWARAGLPVEVDRSQPIEVSRQVQITIGSMVLLGVVLALTVSPWFALVSGFFGAGLVFAGVTGFCGLAEVMARLPWNRRPAAG